MKVRERESQKSNDQRAKGKKKKQIPRRINVWSGLVESAFTGFPFKASTKVGIATEASFPSPNFPFAPFPNAKTSLDSEAMRSPIREMETRNDYQEERW
jgi:hypothetical protein